MVRDDCNSKNAEFISTILLGFSTVHCSLVWAMSIHLVQNFIFTWILLLLQTQCYLTTCVPKKTWLSDAIRSVLADFVLRHLQ